MHDFKIMPDEGEPFYVTSSMRDIRLWERTHRGATVGALGEGVTAQRLFEVAYVTCKRNKLIPEGITEAEFDAAYDFSIESPAAKRARLLKSKITETELPADEDEGEVDFLPDSPGREEASTGQ
jgi:hypothetical protein